MKLSDPRDYDFTYLSLGAGVQSTALYIMAATGLHDCPDADIAVFADTGDEPHWVYDQLARLEQWGFENGGPPIYVTSKGITLSQSVIGRQREGKRFVSVPLFTLSNTRKDGGMLRRQCTKEFKIEPIERFVRAYLGYQPRYKVRESVRCLLGISVDESQRLKPSRTKWIRNAWPLINAGLSRRACLEIVADAGLPEPKKSACVYCPYRSDREWAEMKELHPEEFERAVEFDDAVRDMTMRGRKQPAFVHRSLVPLREADFDASDHPDLYGDECEGGCFL